MLPSLQWGGGGEAAAAAGGDTLLSHKRAHNLAFLVEVAAGYGARHGSM
jgi:hypothetical protein